MNDSRYAYHGAQTAITLSDGRDVMLFPGAEVDLPANDPFVSSLEQQQLLVAVPPASEPPRPRTRRAADDVDKEPTR